MRVVCKLLAEIPSLRAMNRVVRQALIAGSGVANGTFRLIHFCILSNHLHLIVEAGNAGELSRGMQGLATRTAWAINRALGRKRGKVFSDRYHDHQLTTAREVNAALLYVLNNYRKHMAESGRVLPASYRDPNSSARYLQNRDDADCPLPSPETWLLRIGYLKGGGQIDLSRIPGQGPRRRASTPTGHRP